VSSGQNGAGNKKHILINAFDMSTVGHLSPGQWKVCLFQGSRSHPIRNAWQFSDRRRTPKINRLQNGHWSTGLIWQSCWSAVESTPFSSQIQPGAMIPTRGRLTSVSDELHNGPLRTQLLWVAKVQPHRSQDLFVPTSPSPQWPPWPRT
jgi:hypothetical protein